MSLARRIPQLLRTANYCVRLRLHGVIASSSLSESRLNTHYYYNNYRYNNHNNNNSNNNSYDSTKRYKIIPGILAVSGFTLFYDDIDGGGQQSDSNADRLITVIKSNDVGALKELLSHGFNPNSRHAFGWSPLHVAAFHGKHKCLTMLLKAGASVDVEDQFESLQNIARERGVHFLEILFAREQDFDHRLRNRSSFLGTTPLHYAALGNQPECVRILLDSGANPLARNSAGHLPIDYAKDEHMKNLIRHYTKEFEEKKKRLEAEERKRYPLEQRIKEKIVGQEAAITAVAQAIRRKESFVWAIKK